MAFHPPSNPTRECLPLVIQLMPYYAQQNELTILKELHAKLRDPSKQLHRQLLTDAIIREQWSQKQFSQQQTCKVKNVRNCHQPSTSKSFATTDIVGTKAFASLQSRHKQGKNLYLFRTPEPIELGHGMMMIGDGGDMGKRDVVEVDDDDDCNGEKEEEKEDKGVRLMMDFDGSPNNDAGSRLRKGQLQQPRQRKNKTNNNGKGVVGDAAATNNSSMAKRRADFLRDVGSLYNNKYRMLSRAMYDFYVKRLRITENLETKMLLKKDIEIRNKFELAVFVERGQPVERLVEKGKESRKLVAIEEVFDIIHYYHERVGCGKRVALYDAIKREFANITLNCVLLYMAGCKDCYITGGNLRMDSRRAIELSSQLQSLQRQQQKRMHALMMKNSNNNNIGGNTIISNKDDDNDISNCIQLQQQLQHNNNGGGGGGDGGVVVVDGDGNGTNYGVGLDEIDYSEYFEIGDDEIRCRLCHFVNYQKSRQRPRHSLRSHLHNYHRKLFNEIVKQEERSGGNMVFGHQSAAMQ